MESKGIIMFNKGDKIVVRAIVALYSLRKWYDGPITFFVEQYPKEFDEVLKYFKCDIVHNDLNQNYRVLVRKTEMFKNSPYDRTLWLDADVVVTGKLDEMFSYLDNADFVIPHFAGWWSDAGGAISKRVKRFNGIAEQRFIDGVLKNHYPAVNTGVLSFKKSENWIKFVDYWVNLAHKGAQAKIFIPDEVSCQLLYPFMSEWGLKYFIAPTDFNVSVLHDKEQSKDRRVYHFHGDKHTLPGVTTCEVWKSTFKEMCDGNIANINNFLQYADKRLKIYLHNKDQNIPDTTIVTACDNYYLPILQETFPNWRKYKNIDKYPVIVFVNGIDIEKDPRLDFLRLPNVRLIKWDKEDLDKVDNQRELMLSAFVFGTAKYVTTDYWLKLDADSYATDDRPFITDEMKKYAFFGHKWYYSRPDHIKLLDEWAKTHWKKKLKNAKPMIEEGTIEGRRFYHKTRRTISFIQLHKTRFTKFCVSLFKERKLPAPTQDTVLFYIQNRFDPEYVGTGNFKKSCGFTQGRGRLGAEHIKRKIQEVEEKNKNKLAQSNQPEPKTVEVDLEDEDEYGEQSTIE